MNPSIFLFLAITLSSPIHWSIKSHESLSFSILIPKGTSILSAFETTESSLLSCSWKDKSTGLIGLEQTRTYHCTGFASVSSPTILEMTIINEDDADHTYTIQQN